MVWEGAEYRGRFREVIWDGTATFSGNEILDARPINFFNRDKTLDRVGTNGLAWKALTTGNFGGFDAVVKDGRAGRLAIKTPLIECDVALADIGLDDRVYDKSGELPRFLKVFRLPTVNERRTIRFRRAIALREKGDNPIYVRLTQEDGTRAWTSPIYVYR